MSATSVVGIANQALYILGQKSIISMSDDSEPARLCNGRYSQIRDIVLRSYPWNCAVRRVTLPGGSTPTWEFDYSYPLPTDPYCLRVLAMEDYNESGYTWKIEGRTIVTDTDECNILYIARLTDVNDMDVHIREVISSMLAADICYALTGSVSMSDRLWALYERKFRMAKSIDAQEGIPEDIIDDTFIDARA